MCVCVSIHSRRVARYSIPHTPLWAIVLSPIQFTYRLRARTQQDRPCLALVRLGDVAFIVQLSFWT